MAAVYGASRLGHLRLHNIDLRAGKLAKMVVAHPRKASVHKKVDYGHSKHYGRLLYGHNRNICSWELTTIQNSLLPLLTIIWYLYFI